MDEFYGGNVFGYSIEPTSDKGLHRYVDFYSMLPAHIQNRPDLMKVIYLFQDYLNDGYRKIPMPTKTYSYKNKLDGACGPSTELTTYSEVLRPFNHVPSMYKKLLSSALDYSNIDGDSIEEYNKERDLDTWAIDFDEMDKYKSENSELLIGEYDGLYSYYNEPKQYYNTSDFYNKVSNTIINNPSSTKIFDNIFMYISTPVKNSSITLSESSMTLEELLSMIPLNGDLPEILFTYYACDGDSFHHDMDGFIGNPGVLFSVEARKIPYYYGISDYSDYNEEPPFKTVDSEGNQIYVPYDDLEVPVPYNSSFRVTFGLKARATADNVRAMLSVIENTETIGTFAMTVLPSSRIDIAIFASDNTPCIASALQIIKKYEHPQSFYQKFSWQNEYRHEAKGASIAEKIYRLAYSKDPKVFDYEYLKLVAQHFGYSIETDEEEINKLSYYKTKEEKEKVLRQIIGNMPEYNRMKGTDSGIEMVLLSFGLVGRIVTLFTRGNDKVDGYVEFIDSRLISGDMDEYAEANNIEYDAGNTSQEEDIANEMANQFRNHSKLAGTSIYDWYASPHFRVEFDILKDYLNIARNSDQFTTMAKTIRRIKPINTVFQGFYATLSAEYGSLFINPPVGMQRVKQILFVEANCSFADDWSSQCALELVHDS